MADWSLLPRKQATSWHGTFAISQVVFSAGSHHISSRIVFSVSESQTSNPLEKASQNDWYAQATIGRDSVLDFPLAFSCLSVSKCMKPCHVYFCTLATPFNRWWTLTFCNRLLRDKWEMNVSPTYLIFPDFSTLYLPKCQMILNFRIIQNWKV